MIYDCVDSGNTDLKKLLDRIESMLYPGDKKSIAEKCGVSRQTVYHVLKGDFRNVRVLEEAYNTAFNNKKKITLNPYCETEKALKKLTKK